MSSPYTCNYCNKKYQRKEYYKRHVLLCETLAKTKRERDLENEEYADTPSHRELYLLVQDLVLKYDKLQKDYDVLSSWVCQKKRQLNVVDWLNENLKPDTSFTEWISQIQLNHTHLEAVFQYNYIEGICYILQDLCSRTDAKLPIKAFVQKENVFFLYMENDSWIPATEEYFNKLISEIAKGIMSLFKDWQDTNAHKMQNEHFSSLYIENLKKVIGGNTPIKILNNKIRNKFFKYLRINLNTRQYEIIG